MHTGSRYSQLLASPPLRLLAVFGTPLLALTFLSTIDAARLSFHPVLGDPLSRPDPLTDLPIAALSGFLALHFRKRKGIATLFGVLATAFVVRAVTPVYSPLAIFAWLIELRGTSISKPLAIHALVTLVLSVMVPVALLRTTARDRGIHGTSRFATCGEVRRAGFFATSGISLGNFGRRNVRHAGGEHVLAVMPTGAGKTSCYLIPSVLAQTTDSLVISDIKGAEIFSATAGARSASHRVIRFEPTAEPSETDPAVSPTARWNPLDEVVRGSGDVAMLQRQAEHMIVPGRFGRETHWHRAARELYVLLALHVIYSVRYPSTIGSMRRVLLSTPAGTVEPGSNPRPFFSSRGLRSAKPTTAGAKKNRDLNALFGRILAEPHGRVGDHPWTDPLTGAPTAKHPEVSHLAARFERTETRELSSIVSTLLTFLQPWADERIDQATSESDFSLADVAPGTQGRPVALYIVVPRNDLARLAPLLRLFYGSFASFVSKDPRFADWQTGDGEKRRTYVFLDEFPMLGYMPVFGDMLATLRGYGVTLFVVAQDLAQIQNIYGPHEPITGGCPLFLAAGSQRPETLRHISALAGESTVTWERAGQSVSGGGFFGRRSRSKSTADARRPLLTAGEVRTLESSEALLFAPSLHPVRLTKVPYYTDRDLLALSNLVPPSAPIPSHPDLEAPS